ncbi:MAG: hypothetical protein WDM89_11975 [Rhizomicrobium sp.]
MGALVVLLRRRAQGDLAMAAMLISALLFTASFFVISIACDYRYLYFLDMGVVDRRFLSGDRAALLVPGRGDVIRIVL